MQKKSTIKNAQKCINLIEIKNWKFTGNFEMEREKKTFSQYVFFLLSRPFESFFGDRCVVPRKHPVSRPLALEPKSIRSSEYVFSIFKTSVGLAWAQNRGGSELRRACQSSVLSRDSVLVGSRHLSCVEASLSGTGKMRRLGQLELLHVARISKDVATCRFE